MPTILPLAPSASLEPSGALAPSSSTTYIDAPAGTLPLTGSQTSTYQRAVEYIDAPIGHIGGTLVIGGGGIVKVGGTSVNQEPQRRQPRHYQPQQAPPKLIHISYQVGHDAPTGRITLGGTISEAYTPGAARLSPADVRELERRFRLVYPQPDTEPASELSRILEPFLGVKT